MTRKQGAGINTGSLFFIDGGIKWIEWIVNWQNWAMKKINEKGGN